MLNTLHSFAWRAHWPACRPSIRYDFYQIWSSDPFPSFGDVAANGRSEPCLIDAARCMDVRLPARRYLAFECGGSNAAPVFVGD